MKIPSAQSVMLVLVMSTGAMTASAAGFSASGLISTQLPTPTKLPNPGLTVTLQPFFIYSAKFICGNQQSGTVIGQSIDLPNREPGSYATGLNILNLDQTAPDIQVRAVLNDTNTSVLIRSIQVQNKFMSTSVYCEEINDKLEAASLLPPPNNDDVLEGRLIIERYQRDLDVKATYTYAASDRFSTSIGVSNGIAIPEPEYTGSFISAIGGAGGLGLGASIDVESIQAIDRRLINSN